MNSPRPIHYQAGAYLLEALVGILIFSLGILGIVGLQAASLRNTSDASLRAEAVFAANELIGRMWADDQSQLIGNYSSTFGTGQPYLNFAADLKAAQGAAWIQDPAVVFSAGPSPTSSTVNIAIQWRTCVDAASPSCTSLKEVHTYQTSAVIGQNQW
jgi:type IV pilus assembly protein PilV